MATETDISEAESAIFTQNVATADLGNSIADLSLQDETSQSEPGNAPDIRKLVTPPRPLMIYTRTQILLLHDSPLVKPPPDMPALKDWFGTENEIALNKKEQEPSATSATRDRRFRRDPEDGETPARPAFRSALTQPSPMGNFKHQSSRASDRDRDKEVDKDRERDIRDKEGQERLRHLSDKYDRDRLALPSTLTGLRTKERDPAPHLAAVGPSSRTNAQAQTPTPTIASRRADAREAAKKKGGETSEDWRKGTDARSTREERPDIPPKDRDERERHRSRVRDPSRIRRELSLIRRDPAYIRERDRAAGREVDGEMDREGERDRDRDRVRPLPPSYHRDRDRPSGREGDGERDTERPPSYYRDRDRALGREVDGEREKDRDRDRDRYKERLKDLRVETRDQREGPLRRERDRELDLELDDPRRWRDDGKRDERFAAREERLAARRELRDRDRERAREKTSHEASHDTHHDRRWSAAEERDGRSKRSSGRDRRSGATEEGKEKDDRKDREREREKEPAWMDTYIPSDSNAGILGSKGGDGELDGIQVWKKGMKEKEQRDKCLSKDEEQADAGLSALPGKTETLEKPLDEIQLFKLMMKREEERKRSEKEKVDELRSGVSPLSETVPDLVGRDKVSAASGDSVVSPSSRHTGEESSVPAPALPSERSSPQIHVAPASSSNGPRSLLTILASSPSSDSTLAVNSNTSSLGTALDRTKVPGPRIVSKSPDATPSTTRSLVDPIPASSLPSVQFQPPQGSRLLAFGARAPPSAPTPQVVKSQTPLSNGLHSQSSAQQTFHHPSSVQPHRPLQNAGISPIPQTSDAVVHGSFKTEVLPQQSFSPFEDPRGAGNFINQADSLRRTSVVSLGERVPFNAAHDYSNLGSAGASSNAVGLPISHSSSSLESANVVSGNAYATGKGSRFAKFFDGKSRDGPLTKAQTPPVGFPSSSPNPGQRQDQGNFNGMLGNTTDRAMDDLFAMLNNSAQGQRGNAVNPAPMSGGLSFGQGHGLHSLQQQQIHHHQQQQQQQHQHQQQHLSNHSRLDSLYESRLDDRNFVPDGMVPGLRSVPPQRSRENSMFSDPQDEPIPFNTQRLPPQRSLDQMFSGPTYQQAGIGRNVGMPLQQPHYRGGPSPISSQNSLQGPPQQRLPPGLANLGGRPPHEPSQFLGMPGMQPGGLHGALHGNGSSPQGFNNFAAGGDLGYGGPQIRLPPPGPHQLQNPHPHNQMGGLGHPSNMDLRGPSQAQLLGMGGLGGLRGSSGGFGPQQGPNAQMQAPLIGMRQQQQQQQQQQHLPPHMMPHLLPPHLQQGIPGATNQPAHDLMALLMGGSHRG